MSKGIESYVVLGITRNSWSVYILWEWIIDYFKNMTNSRTLLSRHRLTAHAQIISRLSLIKSRHLITRSVLNSKKNLYIYDDIQIYLIFLRKLIGLVKDKYTDE